MDVENDRWKKTWDEKGCQFVDIFGYCKFIYLYKLFKTLFAMEHLY